MLSAENLVLFLHVSKRITNKYPEKIKISEQMPTAEFFIIGGMILVGIIFLLIAHTHILGESEETRKLGVKAEADEITSLVYRISKDPAPYLHYCQFINLANITVESNKLKYERAGFSFVSLLPENITDVRLVETTLLCVIKRDGKIILSGEAPEILVCPSERICPGAPESEKDTLGNDCCPSDKPVCTNGHCCPIDKPKWCSKPVTGNPRCMSDSEYKTDCVKCKKTYKIVVVANNYANLDAYRMRAEREMEIVRRESPFRECPDCLNITILNLNCPADPFSSGAIIGCVHKNYGHDYNMIYAVNGDNWCNGYCIGIGGTFTICGGGLPTELRDYCAIHEIGHCGGHLCDEYGYGYWIGEGCPPEGWSPYNLVTAGGCNAFNCGGAQRCCGTKLKPEDPTDRTVDIMGGGGGMTDCSGMYVQPRSFRDFNYDRFKNSLPLQDYCP